MSSGKGKKGCGARGVWRKGRKVDLVCRDRNRSARVLKGYWQRELNMTNVSVLIVGSKTAKWLRYVGRTAL